MTSSGGRYQSDTYCCLNGTTSKDYPSAWYAFDAGNARFYVLDAAWPNSNVGSGDPYKNDYDYHWAPGQRRVQWLENDLATQPEPLKFAFFHFPLYSDNAAESADPYLRGPTASRGCWPQQRRHRLQRPRAHVPAQPRRIPAGWSPT